MGSTVCISSSPLGLQATFRFFGAVLAMVSENEYVKSKAWSASELSALRRVEQRAAGRKMSVEGKFAVQVRRDHGRNYDFPIQLCVA